MAPERGLRLTRQDSGWALHLDDPRDGDQVIRHEDLVLLLVDPSVNLALGHGRIEIQGNEERLDLVIVRKAVMELPRQGHY